MMFYVESLDWWITNGTAERRRVRKGKNKLESAAIADEPVPEFECIFDSIQESHEMVTANRIDLEEGCEGKENVTRGSIFNVPVGIKGI